MSLRAVAGAVFNTLVLNTSILLRTVRRRTSQDRTRVQAPRTRACPALGQANAVVPAERGAANGASIPSAG